MTTLPTSIAAKHYANIVQCDAIYRRLIGAASHIVRRAHESGASSDEVTAVLSEAEALIASVRQTGTVRDFVHIRELLGGYLESIAAGAPISAAEARAVRTGFTDLDQLLGGLKRGDLVIVAARPSLGKTSLVLNFARNAAVAQSATVAFFSIEMAAEQLVQRLLATESGVDSTRLTFGHHTEREQRKVMQAMGVLSDLPDLLRRLRIADDVRHASQGQAPAARARPRPHRRRLPAADVERPAQREPRAGGERASRDPSSSWPATSTCRSSPAHSSRVRPRRDANNIPMLSDLRESGSIEQDADVVMFIYREDKYITREQWEKDHAGDDKHREYPAGITQVIVAKHRNGPTGTIAMRFRDKIARFEDLLVRADSDWEGE